MHRHALALLAALVLASAARAEDRIAPGQEGSLTMPGSQVPCVLHVPSDWAEGKRLPLILFMHGSGDKPGTVMFSSAVPTGYLICGLAYAGQPEPGPISGEAARVTAMVKFIDEVRARIDQLYGIDQRRVFLTGLSMGGWAVDMYGLTKEARGRYRGFVIMAAGARTDGVVDLSVAAGLPVLVLNGDQDPNLKAANEGMPLLEKAGCIAEQVVLKGQPHVPSLDSTNGPLKEWLARAEKMGPHERQVSPIAWKRATLTGAPDKVGDTTLGRWLLDQDFVKQASADQPVLVFCGSHADAAPGQPAPPALESAVVEEKTFSFPEASSVPLAARGFNCIMVDTTAIDPKANKSLNAATPPLVALISADHTSVSLFKGKSRLSESSLLPEMKKLMGKAEAASIDSSASDIQPALREMKELKKKLAAKDELILKLRTTPATDDATRKAKSERIEAETKALEALEAHWTELYEKAAK
jgi:predicted esterase